MTRRTVTQADFRAGLVRTCPYCGGMLADDQLFCRRSRCRIEHEQLVRELVRVLTIVSDRFRYPRG